MPPWVNPWLILAIMASLSVHAMIVYVPIFNSIFGITSLTMQEWGIVLAFSFPVILIDEVLKFVARILNAQDLKKRLKND